MCGTLAVRLSAVAILCKSWGNLLGSHRTTAVQGRAIAGQARAVAGSIAEMVLRCPPSHLEMRTTSAPTVGLQCEADATAMGTAKLEPTAQRFGG